MLAYLQTNEFEEWVRNHNFSRLTSQTITNEVEFLEVIHAVRVRGFALVDQYANMGLSGLAVPLLDKKGHPVGALSTTFQNIAYPEDSSLRKLLPLLQQTADVMREVI